MSWDTLDARREKFYNCGYDGLYESKEKAVLFNCARRGFQFPPLSEIYIPPFLLKGDVVTKDIRPSHHILQLMYCDEDVTSWPINPVELMNGVYPTDSELPQSDMNKLAATEGEIQSDMNNLTTPEDEIQSDMHNLTAAEGELQSDNIRTGAKDEIQSGMNNLTASDEEIQSESSDNDIYMSEEDGSIEDACDAAHAQPATCQIQAFLQNEDFVTGNLNCTISGNRVIACDDARAAKCSVKEKEDDCPTSDDDVEVSDNLYNLNLEQNNNVSPDSLGNSCPDVVAKMFDSDESEDLYFNRFKKYSFVRKWVGRDCTKEFPGLTSKHLQKSQNVTLPKSDLTIKNITKLVFSCSTEPSKTVTENQASNRPQPNNSKSLLIENLPNNVDRECLINFLQPFGEIKSLVIVPSGCNLSARLQIDAELEWLIDCLDGTNPFGAESPTLRCYQEE